MRLIPRLFSSALAVCAVFLIVGAERADQPGQKSRLNLQLQKGKTYTFQVTAPQQISTLPAAPSSLPSDKSKLGDEPRKGDDTQKKENAETRESQRQGDESLAQQNSTEDLEYRIEVLDTSGEETTLGVRVTQSSPSASSSPRSANSNPATNPSPGAATVSGSGVDLGTYTFKVDSKGKICDSKNADANRPSSPGQRADEKRGSTPGQTLPKTSPQGTLAAHLQMILGSGLHDQELEVGKVYTPAVSVPAKSDPSDPSEVSTPRDKKDTNSPTDKARQPFATDPASSPPDIHPQVALRFEGTSRVGDKELARFTVLGPATASPAPASARTDQAAPGTAPREGKDTSSATRPGRLEERLGEVTYRTSDGILERGSAICPLSAQKSGADPLKGASLTIRRIDSNISIPGAGSK